MNAGYDAPRHPQFTLPKDSVVAKKPVATGVSVKPGAAPGGGFEVQVALAWPLKVTTADPGTARLPSVTSIAV